MLFQILYSITGNGRATVEADDADAAIKLFYDGTFEPEDDVLEYSFADCNPVASGD
jgi:hypothetical protein